jgi:hypothetical protein
MQRASQTAGRPWVMGREMFVFGDFVAFCSLYPVQIHSIGLHDMNSLHFVSPPALKTASVKRAPSSGQVANQ